MAARGKRSDPLSELAGLERELEAQGTGLARGYLLRGDERYFHDRAIERLRARALADGYEVVLHDGSKDSTDFSLAALLDDASGGGLFAARRLIVLRNPEEHLKKQGSDQSPLTRVLCGFVGAAQDHGTLVVSAPGLRADHALSKALVAAGGRLLELRKLWDSPPPWSPDPTQVELVKWFVGRARERGVAMDPRRAVYVCAATGNDLHALDDQLERLAASGGADVREIVPWDAATTPWAVADPIVAGDLPRGLFGIESLFRGGFQEKSGKRLVDGVALANMLFSSLLRNVRQALAVRLALEQGESPEMAARAAGMGGPPQALKAGVERARGRSSASWRRMLDELAALERRAKSGAGVDENDFALLALTWRQHAEAPARGRR